MRESYLLLDSGDFEKLEQLGPFRIRRPAAQAVWKRTLKTWDEVDAHFIRDAKGQGAWTIRDPKLRQPFNLNLHGIDVLVRLTDFGHLGFFPEHHAFFSTFQEHLQEKNPQVLNLFAYTGIGTIALAKAGATVTHVDASKTSVQWARDMAAANLGPDAAIRWIVDDARKFVRREVSRQRFYDAVILDPPSFGRGTKNEVWKIEDDLVPLLEEIKKLLTPDWSFVFLSCHSPQYSPLTLENLLHQSLGKTTIASGEMVVKGNPFNLPSGIYGLASP